MNTRHDPLSGTATAVAETPTATPSTPPAAKAGGGLKKLNLGGIAKKKDEGKTAYPVFPDSDGVAAEIAARIAERSEQFDALKSALETDKAELSRIHVRPWYLSHFHRKTDVPSSVLVNYTVAARSAGSSSVVLTADPQTKTPETKGAVRVTVKEQYCAFPNEDPFIAILGDRVSKYFRQSFELKIDGDKLPADRASELVEKIQQLFSEYDCADALEAKECVVPVDNFKALRFAELELTESLALENVGDKGLTQCAVSTKGVRK